MPAKYLAKINFQYIMMYYGFFSYIEVGSLDKYLGIDNYIERENYTLTRKVYFSHMCDGNTYIHNLHCLYFPLLYGQVVDTLKWPSNLWMLSKRESSI